MTLRVTFKVSSTKTSKPKKIRHLYNLPSLPNYPKLCNLSLKILELCTTPNLNNSCNR